MRSIIHVDMDAFYASVEQRDDPSLRGRPVIVGGHPRRGVVLAASYEVRPFGVRSAMPMARAVRMAPAAVVVPPRFDRYAEASEKVFEIFASVTPLIEPLSLDEAFLDVTASTSLFGTPEKIARSLRARIASELHLPASAGIASAKLVAKIASDLAKPDGQVLVPQGEEAKFLAPLPVWRLWGVGPKTEQTLRNLGLRTMGDVAAKDPGWLERHLGSHGTQLAALARGEDDRPVIPDRAAKSIGAEDTFGEDLVGVDALEPHIHSQALRVGRRLRRAGSTASIVVLKLKTSDFKLMTRRLTLPEPTDDGGELFRAARSLLDKAPPAAPIRLTGVSAQGLKAGAEQLALLGPSAKAKRLNATLDKIAERFGNQAVIPADLVGNREEDDDEARRRAGASRLDLERSPRGPGRER